MGANSILGAYSNKYGNSFTINSTCFTRFTSTDLVLSVLDLNIKKYTLALASDVQLIISRRFVIREKKLKIHVSYWTALCGEYQWIFLSPP